MSPLPFREGAVDDTMNLTARAELANAVRRRYQSATGKELWQAPERLTADLLWDDVGNIAAEASGNKIR